MTLAGRARRWHPWLLLAPAMTLFIVFMAAPMGLMFLTSLRAFDAGTGRTGELTLANYLRVIGDGYYWTVMGRTVGLGLTVTFLCVLAGYPVAYHFYTAPARRRSLLALIIVSPLLISVVIRTYGWMIVLGSNGLVNEALRGLRLVGEPLRLLYTEGAIVVGLSHVLLPFMVLAILSALEGIDPALSLAAENLGASPYGAFWRVTAPLSLPGVISGSLIVFTVASSAFITPALLGGPKVRVFSSLIYQQVVHLLNWPFGAALVYVLLAVTGVLVLAAAWLARPRAEALVAR